MSRRRLHRPQLEALEAMTLLSAAGARVQAHDAVHHRLNPVVSPSTVVPSSGSGELSGTLNGTFFRQQGNGGTGAIYRLFASGKVGAPGRTLQVGGFQASGFTADGAGGGNLILSAGSRPGSLSLRLTEIAGPSASAPDDYLFAYAVAGFPDGRGTGTVAITLRPIKSVIPGRPLSNPGFFGNASLTFRPDPPPLDG
jgi:hypothetical protein